MKTISMKFFLAAFALMLTMSAFAQKKNVQNAVMDFRAYEKAIQNKNMAGAKKSILSAKTYIDLAAENAETANDIKMYFFKGNIYMAVTAMAMMMTDDEELKAFANEATLQAGLDAWKTCYAQDSRNVYKDDIKMAVMMQAQIAISMAGESFGSQDYETAYQLYASSAKLYEIILPDGTENYGLVSHNAGLSAERLEKFDLAFMHYETAAKAGYEPAKCLARAADALMRQDKPDEAMKYIIAASEKYPGDGSIIITMAEMALKTGQDELAIASLIKAIEKDPNNGVYHWAVGTVYQKLSRTEEAIAAYTKAIKLSPNDDRPYFSLGSIHFNKAVDYLDQANKLRLGDPKFEELENLAKEEFQKAAPYLEKVIELTGDAGNKEVLMNLVIIFRRLDNSSKALDYKKRADAIK
jgi:tetratricopeptide (TPR) repeat protein